MEETKTDPSIEKPEPHTSNDVDKAVAAADKLNAAAERVEKANAETARLQARAALGGSTEAGKPVEKEEKKEETDKEYRARVEKELASGKTEFGN